jgi:hypothetical protein
MTDSFQATLHALRENPGDSSLLAEMIAALYPVSGVSVMTFGSVLPAGTVSATGAVAARIDEVQLDLGEGPAWDALRILRPVLEPDVQAHPGGVWPAFSEALGREDVGAIFAFPLRIGPLGLGALTLHSRHRLELTGEQIAQVAALAEVVGGLILRNALLGIRGRDDGNSVDPLFSRRFIHQATGMVIVQTGTAPDDAELIIRGYAFAHDLTMRQVSEQILERRLTFTAPTIGIKDR